MIQEEKTIQWLMDRLNAINHRPQVYAGLENATEAHRGIALLRDVITSYRGDHNLNDGMEPRTKPGIGLRPASVLIPVVNRPDGLTILFTQRTDHLTHHPGQISFPGGRVDQCDRDAEHTALRETEEEIGLQANCIQIVGRLDDYLTRTGFVVTPVVGVVEPPFELQPEPEEVAEIFEVPLSFLLDTENHRQHTRMFEGYTRTYYAFPYKDYFIWGATAGMLMNLYQVLSR